MNNQLSRADFLEITGLPEQGPFELIPDRHPHNGRWMMMVRAEGSSDYLVEPAPVQHYHDQIRETAPDLADQVGDFLEELKRCSQDQE